MTASRPGFWQKHRELVWSNPDAHDSIHIRAALLHPRFGQLLDIAVEFGLERVRQEWAVLQAARLPAANRATDAVNRILCNIDKGFTLAAARN